MSFAWPGTEFRFIILNGGLAAIEFLIVWAHLIPPCHRQRTSPVWHTP